MAGVETGPAEDGNDVDAAGDVPYAKVWKRQWRPTKDRVRCDGWG